MKHVVLSMSVGLASLISLSTQAASITVTTFKDEMGFAGSLVQRCLFGTGGACSLRAAITLANALPGHDDIVLPPGVYRMALRGAQEDGNLTGDYDIKDSLAILGPANKATIDGSALDRLFEIHSGDVTMKNIMLINGSVMAGQDGIAGAIHVHPQGRMPSMTLVMENSHLKNNRARYGGAIGLKSAHGVPLLLKLDNVQFEDNIGVSGGAIHSAGANLVINNSRFIGNDAIELTPGEGSHGGAILSTRGAWLYNTRFLENSAAFGGAIWSSGLLEATDGEFIGNQASVGGGAIAQGSTSGLGTFHIEKTAFKDNIANGNGGAILVPRETSADNLGFADVFFENNRSLTGYGGAIYSEAENLHAERVTFSGNSALWGGGALTNASISSLILNTTFSGNQASGGGGALMNIGGSLDLVHVTFQGNQLPGQFGAAIYSGVGGVVNLKNTLVGVHAGPACYAKDGVVKSLGHNLDAANTCKLAQVQGDLINKNPKLGVFGNHGGFSPTHVPLAGSPAIDKGKIVNDVAVDQRQLSRPVGLSSDIGAVEFQPWVDED